MKKMMIVAAFAIMMTSCGMLQKSSSNEQTANNAQTTTNTTTATDALSAGQGAGNALLALYKQYKADGNKYDYKNMQNVLNTVTLVANCEGLKTNYKDKTYLKDFGKGMIASSLGLVTQNNVETVTNSLAEMVKSNETVQNAATQVQNTATTAAGYANTAAQYASSLSSILSLFGSK
jgi:hypothetical protein